MGSKNKRYIEDEGGKIMKRREDTSLKGVLGSIAIVLIMLLIQVPAYGATNCLVAGDPDADCDGFSNFEDSSGFFPNMFWDRPDLFVILLPCMDNPYNPCATDQSLLPTNPLGILSTAARDDLNLTVHGITYDDTCCTSSCSYISGCVRNVTAHQKAVRIAENLSTASPDKLGYMARGTPNTTSDLGTVFTLNITNAVDEVCGKKKVKRCIASDGSATTQQGVTHNYIMHTIAHETGHAIYLTNPCSTDIGCHYPTIESPEETPTILDYSTFYTSGRGTITWYIGSRYDPADREFNLVP